MTERDLLPHEAERNPIVFTRDGEVFANSRDVADLFEKRHDHVLRDIENLIRFEPDLGRRGFAEGCVPKFGETSRQVPMPNGGTRSERSFDMTRDGFTLLAMGFSGPRALKWKLRYIEAFNAMESELRSQPAFDPSLMLNDPSALRGLLANYADKVIALEAKVAEQGDDVAALDRIAKSEGSLCVTDAAKALQVRPKDLFDYLKSHGWIYRRPGADHWIGYQARTNGGDLEHKVTTVLRADGSEKTTEQVRVTPQGLAKLAKLLSRSARAA